MHHYPRQSGAAPSSGSSGVTSPTTTSSSIAATGSQLSSLTTATDVTSGLVSSSTSLASLSRSADLTTSSSSIAATSTSSPTSTSPPSSSAPNTTSYTPASTPLSSSIASSPSSSVLSASTTTETPTSSSLQQGTPTTITSAYTTYVNGSQVLTSTTIPSTIPELSAPSPSSDRTAIIAGSAAGGTALLILLLSLAFCARRKRFKRLDFLDAITLKRKQAHSRATLLDGEDLGVRPTPHRYTDYETPWDGNKPALMVARGTPGRPPPTLPSRWSSTDSAFREDVWPAANEGTRLMDPLANRDDFDIDIDLGRIVDDVMGPSSTAAHFSGRSVSSAYRGSVVESEGVVHSRTVSNASNAVLLEAAGMSGTVGSTPVRSSPLAQQGTKSASVKHPVGDPL